MGQISMAKIELTENEIDAAVAVLRSGALRQGKQCAAFETAFAEKVGAKYAITSANGSAALHLAYMSFLEPGDEVLVPSFTFIATASMVTMSGGKPVFCDIDPDTFLMDLKDAESKVTEKTRVIAPVHLFGNPCDVEAVESFAKKHELKIVWDAAQAHGAEINGKDIGAFDDFVCYSFYPSKNMFVGEGGITCTNDDALAEKLRFLRTHGQTGKYYHTMMGLNYRMTDVEAAIGREQLKRLDEMLGIRRRNADLLNKGLKNILGVTPQEVTTDGVHAWHQYCVVVDKNLCGLDRDVLSEKLREKGIATGVHYPRGLHQQPIMQKLYGKFNFPVTESLAQNILALPVHHGLSQENIEYIIDSTQEIINK
jgi:perosamine synthetase